ncbi:orotidine-5'-phosphate decarboxylase [Candidatus Parcubacteria bacterium]|nr:orotidine-5'-phosphate decarboxylase [Candidatus Parcubacteria bacterium]
MNWREEAKKRVVLALDTPNAKEGTRLLERLGPRIKIVKVHTLCDELGASDAMHLVHRGAKRRKGFFDLKLFDTSGTVIARAQIAKRAGAGMLTVHGRGEPAMIRGAVLYGPLHVFAVMRLTTETRSTVGGLDAIGEWASRAINAGVKGLVTPAADLPFLAENLRLNLNRKIWLVVPGIRPAGQSADEHVSSATPKEAIRNGADFLVIGRPITQAPDPVAAFDAIVEEVAEALAKRERGGNP